jgi:hypothetical protein
MRISSGGEWSQPKAAPDEARAGRWTMSENG